MKMSSVSASKSTTRSHVKLLSVLVGVFLFVPFCFDSVNSAPRASTSEADSPNYGCTLLNDSNRENFNILDGVCLKCYKLFEANSLNLCRLVLFD